MLVILKLTYNHFRWDHSTGAVFVYKSLHVHICHTFVLQSIEEGEILRKQACPPPLVPQATTEMPSSSSAHSHGGWGQSEDGRSEDGDLSTSEKLTNAFFMFSQQRTPVIKEQFFKVHDS